MSIKISHGFYFNLPSLESVHGAVMAMRGEVLDLQRQMEASYLAHAAAREYDRVCVGRHSPLTESYHSPISWVLDDVRQRRRKIRSERRRDPEIDIDFTLTVMPFRGRIFGLYFTEQAEHVALLEGQDWFEPYPFWDNVDAPDHVTANEWQERGETWKAIFAQDRAGRPAGCGFSVELHMEDMHVPDRLLEQSIPDFQSRLFEISKETLRDRIMAKQREDMGEDKWSRCWTGQVFETLAWLKTDEGVSSIQDVSEELKSLMKEDISLAVLADRDALPVAAEASMR